MVDPRENKDVEQQQKYTHRDGDRKGRGVTLIVTGRQLAQKIIGSRT